MKRLLMVAFFAALLFVSPTAGPAVWVVAWAAVLAAA